MTPLPRRAKAMVVALAIGLCLLAGLAVELAAAEPIGRSVAPWPARSGYLLALLALLGPLSLSSARRRWQVHRRANEDHRDALTDLGAVQFDGSELASGARATLQGRLVLHDAPEGSRDGGEPRLNLRASQATSWSTHLPRQLALELLDVRVPVRGVATLVAGSHERWLAFTPEPREGLEAPSRALVVTERSVRTGNMVRLRGAISAAAGGEGWLMHGDHRTPIELASVSPPLLSVPQRAPVAARWRGLAAVLLLFALCWYAAVQYHRSSVRCAAPECIQAGACSWSTSADLSLFRCVRRADLGPASR